MRKKKPVPKITDWHEHTPPTNKPCNVVRCPKCGMKGCWSWWVDYTNKDSEGRPIYRLIRVAHAHFLKPSFEPRRNHNCVLKNTRQRLQPDEGIWSFRLSHPDTIPWYISDQMI